MFESFDLTKFGRHLKKIRRSLGYTQEKAADIAGLATDTLRRIEKGEVIPRYDTLVYLSLTYKKDLLAALRSYSNANTLFRFYYSLDDAILLNDLSALEQLIQDFDTYMNSSSDRSALVNIVATDQFKLILSGVKKHYTSDHPDDLEDFLAAMKISNPEFEPEQFDRFKYTEFELRILFMIASSLSDETHLSNAMMFFCLEHLDESIHATLHEKLLRSKIYFNLSYNFHLMDYHENALKYASEGIDWCNKNYLSFCLAALLYRKGIAQFHLGHPEYLTSLQSSICMLNIQGAYELIDRYKKITRETYGIDI